MFSSFSSTHPESGQKPGPINWFWFDVGSFQRFRGDTMSKQIFSFYSSGSAILLRLIQNGQYKVVLWHWQRKKKHELNPQHVDYASAVESNIHLLCCRCGFVYLAELLKGLILLCVASRAENRPSISYWCAYRWSMLLGAQPSINPA